MFKSKVTISVMLAGLVGGSLFMCVSEYLQGSELWVEWAYPAGIGTAAIIFIFFFESMKILRRREGENENTNR